MASKIKTLTVYPSTVDRDKSETAYTHYRVTRITDSVEFAPGDNIPKAKLQELCDSKYWKVTITSPNT